MPRGDRTGPVGNGPRTGRGAGYCSGFQEPGFMNWGSMGFGRRRGFGGGRGWRNWFYATGLTGQERAAQGMQAFGTVPTANPSSEQELEGLKNQAESLAQSLKSIEQRIAELEKKKE